MATITMATTVVVMILAVTVAMVRVGLGHRGEVRTNARCGVACSRFLQEGDDRS